MNTTVISGRLVRNPGYNEVENERGLHKIAKFVLAVRRNYSDEVSFIPVKAFAKKAEFARDYLMQGTKVMVEGEIVTGNYEDKDTGKKIYTTEVYANRIEFAGAKMVDRPPFPEDAEGFLEIPEGMEEEIDQYETSLTAMEKRGYQDELGEMDIDQIKADGYEFGMDLAFGILEENENNPVRVLDIQKYVNRQYESCSKKKFMKVLETLVHAMGNDEGFIGDMYACNKKARNYYLDEMIQSFNFVFDEMCHGTGSAANCDFDVEE